MMGLIIDNFAGGGGASTGLEAAFARRVDVAINHDEAAIAVHAANHPGTRHYCQSIYSVDPLLPWRTAAECIDWTLPCPSIFDRKRPLKDATCRRIAAGVMRYVVNGARPFIVPVTNSSWNPGRAWSADEPLRTITTAKGCEMAAVAPVFARTAHGERDSSGKKRGRGDHSVEEPFPTVTASRDSALIGASLLPVTHQGGDRAHAVDEPFRTITGAHRGEIALQSAAMLKLRNNCIGSHPEQPIDVISTGGHHGVVAASLIQTGYGEREGQAPRAIDVEQPLGTIVAGGGKHAAVAAFLAQHNTERGNRANPGQPADKPVSTITGRGTQQQVVQTTLVEAGALPDDVMDRAVQVAAFLVKYYGSEIGQYQRADQPLDTITVKPRFAVVTVTLEVAGDAVTFVLVDIGMRMLEPRELARAQGFPDGYILDPECWYRTDSGARKFGKLPKTHQIAKIGNSVCPGLAEALVRANLPEICAGRAAA